MREAGKTGVDFIVSIITYTLLRDQPRYYDVAYIPCLEQQPLVSLRQQCKHNATEAQCDTRVVGSRVLRCDRGGERRGWSRIFFSFRLLLVPEGRRRGNEASPATRSIGMYALYIYVRSMRVQAPQERRMYVQVCRQVSRQADRQQVGTVGWQTTLKAHRDVPLEPLHPLRPTLLLRANFCDAIVILVVRKPPKTSRRIAASRWRNCVVKVPQICNAMLLEQSRRKLSTLGPSCFLITFMTSVVICISKLTTFVYVYMTY